MIDHEGYRANVGIIIANHAGQVFWGKRAGQNSWQFPQGGINPGESPEQALFRELEEEVGLTAAHVEMLGRTHQWLRYQLPERYIRRRTNQKGPTCIGQKQLWFMLRLSEEYEQYICFDTTDKPEFDGWAWVNYQQPSHEVVYFKQDVYRRAMTELAPLIDASTIHMADSCNESFADATAEPVPVSQQPLHKKSAHTRRTGLRYLRRHMRR